MYGVNYKSSDLEGCLVDFENRYVGGNSISEICGELTKYPPNGYERIIFNFSDVRGIDNTALATLINIIFKCGCNNVEIHGASYSVRKALKDLNLDQYVVMKKNKSLLFF